MTDGGRRLARILQRLKRELQAGRTTAAIAKKAEKLFRNSGGKPAFKGYQGFRDVICVSVDEEVVHTAGSRRKLIDGNIVTIDLGLKYKGYFSDMAATYGIGRISPLKNKLIKTTQRALQEAIKIAKAGKTVYDISRRIEEVIKKEGFYPVKELTGHGVGKKLHESPLIPNYAAEQLKGITLREGMVLAIEPIAAIGSGQIVTEAEGQRIVTKNGKEAAHFEHSVVVGRKKASILTQLQY